MPSDIIKRINWRIKLSPKKPDSRPRNNSSQDERMGRQKKKILITGAHRSGTTWLWKIFQAGNCRSALSEPLNKQGKCLDKINFGCWFPYLDPKQSYPEVSLALDDLIKERENLPQNRFLNRMRKGKPFNLIKDPIGLFACEWYFQHYGTENIILIRHPAAFVFSLMRVKWYHPFEDFVPGKNLPPIVQQKYWDRIQEEATNRSDIITHATLLWCVLYSYVSQLFENYKNDPKWHFVIHEHLSRNPAEEISYLLQKVGVKETRRQTQRIKELSYAKPQVDLNTKEVHVLKRDSKKMAKKWKEVLTEEQIKKIRNESKEIWPNFYGDEDW